ncbi:MAG: hypothetical protein IT260_19650 [Saprospiraceae bacterium]|nr:hypothetical protein [Saprospiraceae bacterium]
MKFRILLCCGLLFGLFNACRKSAEPTSAPAFVFWAECGKCLVPLTHQFTLNDTQLLDETGAVLPDSLFQLARTLESSMPAPLCSSDEGVYGCGTCYDGTSYFVRTSCNGLDRTWQFDPKDDTLPADIKAYAGLLKNVFSACAE